MRKHLVRITLILLLALLLLNTAALTQRIALQAAQIEALNGQIAHVNERVTSVQRFAVSRAEQPAPVTQVKTVEVPTPELVPSLSPLQTAGAVAIGILAVIKQYVYGWRVN